jgi:hypothetical protein
LPTKAIFLPSGEKAARPPNGLSISACSIPGADGPVGALSALAAAEINAARLPLSNAKRRVIGIFVFSLGP